MSLTMVSSNVAGYTKKQLTAAVLFTGYCIGNIIGPQTFISSEKRASAFILSVTPDISLPFPSYSPVLLLLILPPPPAVLSIQHPGCPTVYRGAQLS